MHGRRPLDDLFLRFQDPATVSPAKLCTRKELFMMGTYIADFHISFYIPEIKKLAFYLPHVRILGNNHCGKTCRETLKRCREIKGVLFHHDYAGRVVASFHTKHSLNTMAVIYLCLLKALHWINLVHQHR